MSALQNAPIFGLASSSIPGSSSNAKVSGPLHIDRKHELLRKLAAKKPDSASNLAFLILDVLNSVARRGVGLHLIPQYVAQRTGRPLQFPDGPSLEKVLAGYPQFF